MQRRCSWPQHNHRHDGHRRADSDGIQAYLIAAPNADVGSTVLPVIRDSANDFARAYNTHGDGQFSYASAEGDVEDVVCHLSSTFAARVSATAAPDLR
jgi:predicted RNA-binding protein with TRAM domain